MKILPKNAGLSQIYTNHCIMATVVMTLNNKGFEARDIMATTGHKSEVSIHSYVAKCPPKKRHNMSDALANTLRPEDAKKSKPNSTKVTSELNIQKENFAIDKPPALELFPTFDEDNNIPDNAILEVLTQIGNTTSGIVTNKTQRKAEEPKMINVSSVSNVDNVNHHPMMPQMYFRNSSVTINYNFSK